MFEVSNVMTEQAKADLAGHVRGLRAFRDPRPESLPGWTVHDLRLLVGMVLGAIAGLAFGLLLGRM